MKKSIGLFMALCIALITFLPCMNVYAEGGKAVVNVEIQDVFESFKGDISLFLRNPVSDDIKEFKNGDFKNVTFEVTTFGECMFLTSEKNGEWVFVDSATLQEPKPFTVKENDVISVSLLLYPTEKNADYGNYIKLLDAGIDAITENDAVANVFENMGVGINNDSSSAVVRNSNSQNSFDFDTWHKGAMASFEKFKELFSALEDDTSWQGYLSTADLRRNISLPFYMKSVRNAKEDTWLNMSNTDLFIWQDTYLVFVEMMDKGGTYFSNTFISSDSQKYWLETIIGTSAWNGNGSEDVYNAYVEWLEYQKTYYTYYGYPYNFINDRSFAEETSFLPDDSVKENEDEEIAEVIEEELDEKDIAEIKGDDDTNKGIVHQSKNNWSDFVSKALKHWITLILIAVVGIAYLIVRKIRKSKNINEQTK